MGFYSEISWASVSLGRMDQYLWPLYEKSLTEGETRENVAEYLKNLYRLLNTYGDGACALNIGGLDAAGNDMTNDLSRLLIEVEREMRTASPIFVVRVHPGMPEDILDSVIDPELFTIGQPTFYGELPCRKAMDTRGVPEKTAVNFTVNSCMGLYSAGEEIASMWGCVFNMHLPLELSLCGGKPLSETLPMEIEKYPGGTPASLDALLDAYSHYQRALFVPFFRINRKNAEQCAANLPNPLLSAITADCVHTGRDRAVGARYNTETVEAMALANTANAIAAIDTLVFREKKYTLEAYLDAARRDYDGDTALLRDIRACEKYGTGSAYADSIARRLCEITAENCRALSFDNVYFLPSLHTLDTNVNFGLNLYSTLDGRLKGTPVAKNAGPTNDVRTADPTSLVISAASIRQELFSGGQPIDLYFDPTLLASKASRDKIKALVKTYFDLGGLQLQVNSIDIDLLEKAYAKPEDYPHLVVRIGGYSRRFTELSPQSQLEFIQRFRREQAI